jgi:hypothetical protein
MDSETGAARLSTRIGPSNAQAARRTVGYASGLLRAAAGLLNSVGSARHSGGAAGPRRGGARNVRHDDHQLPAVAVRLPATRRPPGTTARVLRGYGEVPHEADEVADRLPALALGLCAPQVGQLEVVHAVAAEPRAVDPEQGSELGVDGHVPAVRG